MNGKEELFTQLINASSNAPKDIKTLQSLMVIESKIILVTLIEYLKTTLKLPFMRYAPTEEAIEGAKRFFKRYAAKNGKQLTDFQAQKVWWTQLLNLHKKQNNHQDYHLNM